MSSLQTSNSKRTDVRLNLNASATHSLSPQFMSQTNFLHVKIMLKVRFCTALT